VAAFLAKQRHVAEGTAELYAGYGKSHLLRSFGGRDIGLILRTRPAARGRRTGRCAVRR
jgi:hypothetical protein